MPACTLEIGGVVVARAEGGAFDTEYALFDAHEIELRSNEPGTVREHGYETTVALARDRLEGQGVTAALAEQAAEEMGALVTSYARGAEVRRVAALLRACELFEGRTWNAEAKTYEGGWLEIAALAADIGIEDAARGLQALHLAALLHDAPGDEVVFLSTAEYSSERKAGARSHRRVTLASPASLVEAIRDLSEKRGPRTTREGGPTRPELLDAVRTRLVICASEPSRLKLEALDRALSMRERPQRGPLADAELWAIELQLGEGDAQGALEKIDAIERSRGRAPATTYLRARLALLLKEESPRVIAERASSLALSMSAFAELELLAAEAWTLAGEKRRALAYARDLAENPQVDAAIRARARMLLEGAGGASGERQASIPPEGGRISAIPPARISTVSKRASVVPDRISSVPDRVSPVPSRGSVAPMRKSSPTIPSAPESEASGPGFVAITAGTRASLIPARLPSIEPPPVPREERDDDPFDSSNLRDTPIEPLPIMDVQGSDVPISSHVPLPPPVPEAWSPPRLEAGAPAREPAKSDAGLDPHRIAPTRPSMRAPTMPSISVSRRPAPEPPEQGDEDDDDDDHPNRPRFSKGGSQPPFRTEPPPPHFPPEPLIPRLDGERVERAEMLSLPPGLHGEAVNTRPTNAMEARIYFTLKSRELGRIYRTRFNVELRTDVRSIEILQRHLAERFESGELRSAEEADEVHLHGAFLSEVLARRLGAEWVDLGVSELGYWAMNVPPGTRVWPLGRVIRYVTMQHRERDLVSYFLELQARANGLR